MKSGNHEIKEGIRLLWHSGYYDGVMSGVAEYQGQKVYVEVIKETLNSLKVHDSVYRVFNVYRLTPEQWEELLAWHEDFQTFVGFHTDYYYGENGKGKRSPGTAPGYTHEYAMEMFYERYDLHHKNNGDVTVSIREEENIIGFVIYDVLHGEKWKEWRTDKKSKNVNKQKTCA